MSRLSSDGGMLIIEQHAENTVLELPTFTCIHCNRVIVMNRERKRKRNVCRKCMAITCDALPCVLECDPVARKIADGRPLLFPHQVPRDKVQAWFPSKVRQRTPELWLPPARRS